jgi:hypothetical protein
MTHDENGDHPGAHERQRRDQGTSRQAREPAHAVPAGATAAEAGAEPDEQPRDGDQRPRDTVDAMAG